MKADQNPYDWFVESPKEKIARLFIEEQSCSKERAIEIFEEMQHG